METLHPEGGESPFIVKDDASVAAVLSLEGEDDIQYVSCPVEGCGEALLLTEFDSHIEMHGAEEQDTDEESGPTSKETGIEPGVEDAFDTKLSYALRNLGDDEISSPDSPSSDRQATAKAAWKGLLKMPETSLQSVTLSISKSSRRRLGVSFSSLSKLQHHVMPTFSKKSELGPHANEKQMPPWLVKLLETDGEIKTVNRLDADGKLKRVKVCANQAADIVPVLEQLLEQEPFTEYAYLCHPAVKHISKLRREGKLYIFKISCFVVNIVRRLLWISQHSNDELLYHWC